MLGLRWFWRTMKVLLEYVCQVIFHIWTRFQAKQLHTLLPRENLIVCLHSSCLKLVSLCKIIAICNFTPGYAERDSSKKSCYQILIHNTSTCSTYCAGYRPINWCVTIKRHIFIEAIHAQLCTINFNSHLFLTLDEIFCTITRGLYQKWCYCLPIYTICADIIKVLKYEIKLSYLILDRKSVV